MQPTRANLLKDAGKGHVYAVGAACGIISLTFATLFVWLLYIVAWRNPHQYNVFDFFKPSTIAIFSILFVIAVGFARLAFGMLIRRGKHVSVLAPVTLRIWGAFFAGMSILIFILALLNKDWNQAHSIWTILPTTMTMASAAFVLASRREKLKSASSPECSAPQRGPSG